ncbi:unnamed protein product [Musa textilis]
MVLSFLSTLTTTLQYSYNYPSIFVPKLVHHPVWYYHLINNTDKVLQTLISIQLTSTLP